MSGVRKKSGGKEWVYHAKKVLTDPLKSSFMDAFGHTAAAVVARPKAWTDVVETSPTIARVLYDDNYLYFGFELKKGTFKVPADLSPANSWATDNKVPAASQKVLQDDRCEAFIWPVKKDADPSDLAAQQYFAFEINRTVYILRDTDGKARGKLEAKGLRWDHAEGSDRTLLEFVGGKHHKNMLDDLGFELIQEQQSVRDFSGAGYNHPDKIREALQELQDANPTIGKLVSVTSETGSPKTKGGREIYAFKVSDNVGDDEDEPNIMMVSNHHARELVTPEVALYAAKQLVKLYKEGDAAAKQVVDNHQVYILWTMNPDGLASVWNGNTWQRANSNGVDLNRNYPIGWASGHPHGYTGGCEGDSTPGSETYRGPKPFSEVETQTMKKWQEQRHFAKVMDIHSYARGVRINYGCHPLPQQVHNQQAAAATKVAQKMAYNQEQSCCMGGDIHYAYNQHGSLAFLTELGGGQFQPGSAQREQVIKETWPGFFEFFQLPIPAQGHVFSGTKDAPGSKVEATIKAPDMGFSLGEQSQSNANGRYHLWLPGGDHNIQVIPADGTATKTVKVTCKDDGNVHDIYLGETATPTPAPEPSAAGGAATSSAESTLAGAATAMKNFKKVASPDFTPARN